MTLKINHSFISTKPVGNDSTRIYSDSWNADHVLTGPADASQLNASVVQAVVNDTNIQGSIAAQTLTFSWGGTLAAGRGGFGADISASSGVPLFATGVATFTGTTGSGNFARATSPTFVTPTLGAAVATSINGNTFTTGTYTLTGTAGKTFTFSNTLTLSGVDGTTQTFQASDTIVGRATTDTLTNKTFDTAGAGNSFKINGTAITAVTGSGSNVLSTSPTLVTPVLGTPSSGTLTNCTGLPLAGLSTQASYTIVGNVTGSTASPTAFTIDGLTLKGSPASTDEVIIWDVAGAAIKKATVSGIGASSGVSSLNGLTGAVTLATAGGTLTASGSTITFQGAGGHVNKFRNAAFDIWQRGSGTFTVTTAGAYTADGWIVLPTGASVTADRQFSDLSLSFYALRVIGAASVTDVIVKQRIESVMAAPLTGQNVTVQAKIFNSTGGSITPTLTVKTANAQDNWSATTTDVSAVSLQACANTAWTLVSYTFASNASSYNGIEISFDFGNNFSTNGKSIQICQCDIRATPNLSTGLQSNPPVPELRPVGSEFTLCQRYFQQTTSAVVNHGYASGWCFSSTIAFGYLQYPTMRATPTTAMSAGSTFQALLTGSTFNGSAISITPYNAASALIQLTITGATAGTPGMIRDAGSNNSFFSLSAEL